MAADARAPPVIDFQPYYGRDTAAKQKLVDQIRDACQAKGFFQITNHGVPDELQAGIFQQAKNLFDMPMEEKMKVEKSEGLKSNNRGYDPFRSQNFENQGKGDLKEGFYLGDDLPLDHPSVTAGKFNIGPNVYPPDSITEPQAFKDVTKRYFDAMVTLANDLLRVIALTLGQKENWFHDFVQEPTISTLRLLHYPPQEPGGDGLERGIGAHTDFGAITLLLQDSAGGLQVYDSSTSAWIDVVPTPGAFVVNLGNLMMRWSNDQYISNLHRVINKSGRERYSIPFFFSGNPDFLVKCLPGCEDPVTGPKYGPIVVEDWLRGRYADTYGVEKDKAMKDLSAHLVAA